MLIAKESLELAIGSLKDFGHEVDIANDRFKAGDLGKLDFERLDLQLGDYESDESNDIITLRQASDQLQTVIGIEFPTEDFDITGTIIPPLVTQTKDQLVQAALTDRPYYAAAHFGVAAADASSCLAIVNGTGDPTLEAEYDRFGTYSSAGFSLNIPIRIFDRNQGNKATARFQADASRLTETAARYQVISDVDQAWVGYVQVRRLSDSLQQSLPQRIQRRPLHRPIRLSARRQRAHRLPRHPQRRPLRHPRRPQRLPANLARHPLAQRRFRHRIGPVISTQTLRLIGLYTPFRIWLGPDPSSATIFVRCMRLHL